MLRNNGSFRPETYLDQKYDQMPLSSLIFEDEEEPVAKLFIAFLPPQIIFTNPITSAQILVLLKYNEYRRVVLVNPDDLISVLMTVNLFFDSVIEEIEPDVYEILDVNETFNDAGLENGDIICFTVNSAKKPEIFKNMLGKFTSNDSLANAAAGNNVQEHPRSQNEYETEKSHGYMENAEKNTTKCIVSPSNENVISEDSIEMYEYEIEQHVLQSTKVATNNKSYNSYKSQSYHESNNNTEIKNAASKQLNLPNFKKINPGNNIIQEIISISTTDSEDLHESFEEEIEEGNVILPVSHMDVYMSEEEIEEQAPKTRRIKKKLKKLDEFEEIAPKIYTTPKTKSKKSKRKNSLINLKTGISPLRKKARISNRNAKKRQVFSDSQRSSEEYPDSESDSYLKIGLTVGSIQSRLHEIPYEHFEIKPVAKLNIPPNTTAVFTPPIPMIVNIMSDYFLQTYRGFDFADWSNGLRLTLQNTCTINDIKVSFSIYTGYFCEKE
jgi:hypothetical protein